MRRSLLLALSLLLLFGLLPTRAQSRDDFPIPGGWFYSQANGKGGGGDLGFRVTNEGGIPFWEWFNRYGGVPNVGYPISERFLWNGFTVQAFQKVVLQWRPESRTMAIVNVFDELSAAGKDDWLLTVRQVPRSQDWSSDRGKGWEQIVAAHLALLDPYPALRAAYFAAPDPIALNGLPMGVHELPNVIVVRAQRKVFQQWKVDVPWARAGQVVVANGGDVGKEAGLYPAQALVPRTPAGDLPRSPHLPPASSPAVSSLAGPLPPGPPTQKSLIAGLWHKPLVNDLFMTRIGESGAGWVRTFLTWEEIEPVQTSPPTYNWASADQAIRLLREQGVNPLVNIVDPPTWAAFPTCGPFRTAAMQNRWLQFVRAAVERYKQPPYNVRYWVLYNEPDFRIQNPNDKFGGGWGGGCWGNHAAEYGALLRATYPVIKAADPQAIVVMGPLAADGCEPSFNCAFLREVLDPAKGNAAGSFDMVSFNYFPFYRRNWEQFGTSLLGKAEGFRRTMAEFGTVKPIIVAETGIVLDGTPATEQAQANYVAQALTLALADNGRGDGNGVQIAVWFTLRDSDDPNDRWGLLTPRGEIKPSFRVFQTWVKELAGARLLRNESEPTYGNSPARRCDTGPFFCDALQKYVFAVGDEEKWVLWIDSGPQRHGDRYRTDATRTVELPADRLVVVRDMMGGLLPVTRRGATAILTVTESPVYVTLRR
ncbi:MAG: hypothetical protein RMM58_02665 [Chloroflexota bacterium]|nr:hypothetical protein [Dehalococcoidia bacterium]MDW8252759.1 hypothetical protein [Chloroflexota bacterium]